MLDPIDRILRRCQSGNRLWLIGGTTESVALARAIASLDLPCTVTVTTATAKALYPETPMLKVWVEHLDNEQLEQFIQEEQIVAVLDASHPYAVDISQLAIRVTAQRQIPYLRFERPTVDAGSYNSKEIWLDSFEALLASDYLLRQRVLLTVGYKALPLFQSWQERSTLFARILPAVTSLEAALAAGFTSDRIIAIRPPVSAELEKALWHHWDISLVVTKASGAAGGENIKRTVAAELGIPLVAIARPVVDYPQQTSDLSVALEFCQVHVK
ncbi:MAG: cobalt-precorrin-6A reductase [Coleofasciculaceae cyanobacterium]